MERMNALASITALDAGIHNPARLMIVYLLSRKQDLDYLQLMSLTKLSSGNITTHLNKLVDCGYVHITKSFKGRRPHTAVQLSEMGKRAYLAWGNHILQALPEETKQKLPGLITEQNLNVLRYHLTLREWFPEPDTHKIAWPPLDEIWMC